MDSRLWLLTTLMGIWTIYTRTIPSIRRRSLSLSITSTDGDLDVEELKKEKKDVRWTANKLFSDLIFVCMSPYLQHHSHVQGRKADSQRTTYFN